MKAPIKPLGYSVLVSLISAMAAHPAWAQVLAIAPAAASQPADALDVTTNAPLPALGATTHKINHDDRATPLAKTQPTHWLAQGENEQAVITDVQITPTSEGLTVTLISEQALANGTSRVEGNALITEIPNARLALTNTTAAEQFDPADGIALVQVSSLLGDAVQVVITGTEAPPIAQVSTQAGNLVLSIMPGEATTAVDDSEAIQVVVTATRTEESILNVPRSITVIDREDLERELLFTNNLPDILGRLVPGYGAPNQEDRTTPTGLRGRPIVVLIDGVPQTPNNDGFATSLSTIDPALVERIEVLRGPSAIYGDGGTGGVVNIITRAPTENGVAYNVSAGIDTSLTSNQSDRFGYSGELGASVANEQGYGLLSIAYDTVNGQFDADGNRILPNGIANNDRLGFLAKVGLNLTEQQQLALTYSLFRQLRDTEYTFDNAVAAIPDAEVGRALFIGADYEERPKQTNSVLNLTYRHTDFFGSQLDAQFYYRDTDEVGIFTDLRGLGLPNFFPTLWQTTLQDTELGGRLQIDTPLGNSANLLWGADYSVNETKSPLFVNDVAALDAANQVNVIDRSLDRFPAYEVDSLGLFAQGRWNITEQVQISGGIRYEDVGLSLDDYRLAFNFPRERQGGSNSFDDVLFNVGLLYRPIPEIGLFASFAQGFSIPNVGSALALVGPGFDVTVDELLLPQKVDNYEIGVRANFEQFQATLSGFYNESDLGSSISVDFDTGLARVERSPQRNYGIEATVDWQPSDTWRLGGLFSWNEGENDVDDDGDFDPLSLLEIDPIKVGLYVENETTPEWTNRFDVLMMGTRDRSVDAGVDESAADGYIVVDFTSRLQLGDGVLSLGIGNLFNNQYATIRQQNKFNVTQRAPALGRTLQLRYSINF